MTKFYPVLVRKSCLTRIYFSQNKQRYNCKEIDEFIKKVPSFLSGKYGKNGYKSESVAGFCFLNPRPGTIPLYRYWHSQWKDHFYTINAAEIGVTSHEQIGRHGYISEGVQCYVYPVH